MIVVGCRYGKGSLRERSPAAERLAGLRPVIAVSFERIYQQSADNISPVTCTALGARGAKVRQLIGPAGTVLPQLASLCAG